MHPFDQLTFYEHNFDEKHQIQFYLWGNQKHNAKQLSSQPFLNLDPNALHVDSIYEAKPF